MAKCERTPSILNYQTDANNVVDLKIPSTTVAFVMRCRTAVGLQISLAPPLGTPGQYFSLAAGETYAEDNLALAGDLALHIVAAAAATIEAWLWDG